MRHCAARWKLRIMFRRALLAFLALPGIVAFVVPLLIASADASNRSVSTSGVPVVLTGILLLLWCVRDFFVIGKGTLAPWDPPKRLVMVGLYRHVRNPMYVSVVVLVTGWALVFTSRQLVMEPAADWPSQMKTIVPLPLSFFLSK